MNRGELYEQIRIKSSFLCVGLDTDPAKIPAHLSGTEGLLEFNKSIIDATQDLCVSYKLNLAFYESLGAAGWELVSETLKYIPEDILVIADAKRGDIGNTSEMYAKTFFETYDFDAVTVAPYMGSDSVTPFLGFEDKWVIVLGLTSNSGSKDFQFTKSSEGTPLYETVIQTAASWSTEENMMFVVGATHPQELERIRQIIPNHFLLIPGVGAQGGDLEAIAKYGMNDHCGMLVNSSRGIIYAGKDESFKDDVRAAAIDIQSQMATILASQVSV